MVKLCCDRCGKEITDKYYTINIYSYDVDPEPDYLTACSASAYSNSRESVLRMLNATKMYCKGCKAAIERFMNVNGEPNDEAFI